MLKPIFRIWRSFPSWVHVLATWMVRPKFLLGVSAIIFDKDGRILLFRHTYRIFEWGLPGGGLEYGEEPNLAIEREFLEETGIKIKAEKLISVDVSKEFRRHVSLVYLCKILKGEFSPSIEIAEMKFFDLDKLPKMLFAEKDLIKRVDKLIRSEKRRKK